MLFDIINEGLTPFNVKLLLSYILSLVFAITLHEAAHAYSAYWCGDTTPKNQGRLSLNPLDHLDPMGSLFILLAGFGWGKAVQVNPHNFRDLRRDMMITSAAGPLTNLLLAGVGIGLWHAARYAALNVPALPTDAALTLLILFEVFVTLNLVLMLFNLLPVGPLDGVKVVQWFLPDRLAERYYEFNASFGSILLIGLVFAMWWLPIVGAILFWPVNQLVDLTLHCIAPWGV